MFTLTHKKVWVAGHRGMVGKALVKSLTHESCEVLTVDRTHLDLTSQIKVDEWMSANKPDVVIIAAAKVGGIHANNTYPAHFLYENMMIASNIIHAAYVQNVQKLLFLGSSCIYPRLAKQPMNENELLTGPLEPTNQWYAIAKISGLKMAEAYRYQYGCDFISAMPTNLYGIGDTYHLENSHVIPALIMKIHEAKQNNAKSVTLWGTGDVFREFLFVDDLADACVHLLKKYSDFSPVNIGTGEDMKISHLANMIADVIGYKGQFIYDDSKPNGTPRKLLDVSKIKQLGWQAKMSLRDGLKIAYEDYKGRSL
ncbi:GDP-L-fucose synthase family protein [Candidatus Nucleicultrix amoebiphila]|uniref:GDP-L-fucose synthase n=1 Tax=Candidatus Nucleicultrix amoebiphila FS5 TaxID=1414854 RepID=A0A1W6N3U7_9PROT|nr:GDP-L-fucose synthase [Candidatus Nucleicultrix amoebiphila]ARN84560.1 GDP-L-fucose synthase [Candidatus Nucleicultrix amoebiphila FS5]